MTEDQIKLLAIMRYTDEILDVINHYQDLTTSDLQGVIQAIVTKIINERR